MSHLIGEIGFVQNRKSKRRAHRHPARLRVLPCVSWLAMLALAAAGEKIDWRRSPDIEVRTLPAFLDAAKLGDGDLTTGGEPQMGGEAGYEISFRFKKPSEIEKLRFCQWSQAATHVRLLADTEGKGDYSATLADRRDADPPRLDWLKDGKGKPVTRPGGAHEVKPAWVELPVNRKVYGLRLVADAGQVGFRSGFPDFREIELYGNGLAGPAPAAVQGRRAADGAARPLPPNDLRSTDIRLCTDAWNYGLYQWEKERNKTALRDYHGYQGALKSLREMDANSVRLFDEVVCCDKLLPFPSKLVPAEFTRDWMRPLTEALRADGFKLYYMTHAWKPPFQERGRMAPMPWCRWDYPYHQSDTVFGVNPNYPRAYPCVICNPDFRTKWTEMMRGALAAGAAGVYLTPDEWFFKGHNLARVHCPDCEREFKKAYGYDALPTAKAPAAAMNKDGMVASAIPEDSERYRKWKLFEYERTAALFNGIGRTLRQEFPNAQLVITDHGGRPGLRLEHGMAPDIVWRDSPADLDQVYGAIDLGSCGFAAFIRECAGSAGKGRLLSSCGWGPADTNLPNATLAGIVGEKFLGAGAIEVYRLNYMFMDGGEGVYKRAFRMVRLLEKWGIDRATEPAGAGLLLGRAGEDWNFTRLTALLAGRKTGPRVEHTLYLADSSINKIIDGGESDDRTRTIQHERFAGYAGRRTMEGLLTRGGVPYEVLPTERPDRMQNLGRFSILVAPFQYAMSRQAFGAVKAAVDGGTPLVVYGPAAPADEFGNPYGKPLLEELRGRTNVTFVAESLAARSADGDFLEEQLARVGAACGKACGAFHPNGRDVGCLRTALPDGTQLVMLFNNEGRVGAVPATPPAEVAVSLPGEGRWRMESYSSLTGALTAETVDGAEAFELAGKPLTVTLRPQETKLLRLYR